jgi:hypothetical protein
VQEIAHTVLAPLGVPNTPPQPSASGTASTHRTGTAAGGQQPGNGGAPSAGCPCPAGSGSASTATHQAIVYRITLSAARTQVRLNGTDLFTGKVSTHGHPGMGVHVRLLERSAGASGWKVAARGVTGPLGGVRLRISLAANATLELAGPNGSRSAPVSVTVIKPPVLRLSAGQTMDKLIVAFPAGTPGQTVRLTVLNNGAWDSVTSAPLGPGLQAVFPLPPSVAEGHFYRARLAATGTLPQLLSNTLWVPRTRRHTGAKSIGGPTASPTVTPSPAPTGSPTAPATPTGSPVPTGSSAPSGSSSPAPSTTATAAPATPCPTASPSASALPSQTTTTTTTTSLADPPPGSGTHR